LRKPRDTRHSRSGDNSATISCPGYRITHYRGRAVIAFLVDSDAETLSIVEVFYGGQDYETALLQDAD
jgi:plasmid stabilization system protein ParE